MNKGKWVITGIYSSAIIMGWGGAYVGTQYLKSLLKIPEDAELQTPKGSSDLEKEDTSSEKDVENPQKKISKNFVNPIIRRNIFDSTQAAEVTKQTEKNENATKDTDLELALMGTMVAIPETESVAWIKDIKSGNSQGYILGGNLMGEGTIAKIEREQVWIKRTNGAEELLKFDKSGKKKKAKKKKGGKGKKSKDTGVTKLGKDKFAVDQAVFDELLENPEKLYSQVRAVPKKENGETIGYRLSGIRRKSIFYKLGVKNGDVVHGVNGQQLSNLQNAMDAFKSLANSRSFSFELTRRKKKRTLEYEVQ